MATKKRGSRFCALTLVLWLLCVCVLLLCFLPFREFLLSLLAVIVFAYFGDEETGKGFYDGRWKLNIIFVPFVFLICQIVQLPNLQFLKCKLFSFRTPFLWCIPSLAFRMRFRWTLLYKLPLPLIWNMGTSTVDSLCQRFYRFRALREQPALIFLRRVFKQESVQFNEILIPAALYEGF